MQLTHRTTEPFRGSVAVAAGLLTRAQLHGPSFVPVFRDVFVGASVPKDVRVRVLAVALRAGPGAVVAGPLAALAWEADCPWDDAEAVVGHAQRLHSEEIRARTDRLRPDEVDHCYGVPVTSPVRTAFDLARRDAPRRDAVAAVDALAHVWEFGAPELGVLLDAHPGVRGLCRAREVLRLMDRKAESIPESHMRLALREHGVPPALSQYLVKDYRLDLAWPHLKVAVEYDGEEHRSIGRHGRDLDREDELRALGWTIVHATARQIYYAPARLAAQVMRELAAAAAR